VSFNLANISSEAVSSSSFSPRGILKKHSSAEEIARIKLRIMQAVAKIEAFKFRYEQSLLCAVGRLITRIWPGLELDFGVSSSWDITLYSSGYSCPASIFQDPNSNLVISCLGTEQNLIIPMDNIVGLMLGPGTHGFLDFDWNNRSPWLFFSIFYCNDDQSSEATVGIGCKLWTDLETIFWGIYEQSVKAQVYTQEKLQTDIAELKKIRQYVLTRELNSS